MLSILLLGPPKILRDGAPVELPRRRARALVYYLAAQPGAVGREQIMDMLWPDRERQAAQQLLRTTLHGARKALGPTLLSGEDQLALGGEVEVDARLLAAALPVGDIAALEVALGRYRGDLLAGFSLDDSEAFEEWLAAERERARLLAVRGLTRLATLYEARGDYAPALDSLDRALAFDPLPGGLAARRHAPALPGRRPGRRHPPLRGAARPARCRDSACRRWLRPERCTTR